MLFRLSPDIVAPLFIVVFISFFAGISFRNSHTHTHTTSATMAMVTMTTASLSLATQRLPRCYHPASDKSSSSNNSNKVTTLITTTVILSLWQQNVLAKLKNIYISTFKCLRSATTILQNPHNNKHYYKFKTKNRPVMATKHAVSSLLRTIARQPWWSQADGDIGQRQQQQ